MLECQLLGFLSVLIFLKALKQKEIVIVKKLYIKDTYIFLKKYYVLKIKYRNHDEKIKISHNSHKLLIVTIFLCRAYIRCTTY